MQFQLEIPRKETMPTDVIMPQMGESIFEGTITKWLKQPGEKVQRDEPLFEISTDKVDAEIPSPASGTLQDIKVQAGNTVQVNTIVGTIAGEGEAAGASAPAAPAAQPAKPAAGGDGSRAAQPAQPPAEEPKTTQKAPADLSSQEKTGLERQQQGSVSEYAEGGEQDRVRSSPLVRRIAKENNVDLAKVPGTGMGGRITKEDIEAFISKHGAEAPAAASSYAPPAPSYAPTPVPEAPAAPAVVTPLQPVGGVTPGEIVPMSVMRKKIAEHMVMSKRVSAHVTTVHRVDMTRVAKMRSRHKDDFAARYGMSLTFLPFVARATVEALRTYPIVNASIDGNNIVYHNEINLGIAVALDNGLIVPVIRNADEKNVLGLQRSIVDLASRARARQLKPDEIQAGTFSITNFGSFGSVFATPVINQPQVAILGVGAVEKVPVVVDDAIAIRSQCFLALSFDHRLIDGALGDQFTGKVKSVLESWSEEVL